MGNQLCPASTKNLIQQFSDIERGDKTYQILFKGCLNEESNQDHQIEINPQQQINIRRYGQKNNSVYLNVENFPHSKIRQTSDQESNACPQKPVKEKLDYMQLKIEGGGTYKGQTKNGLPEGEGEQFYLDGDHFQGRFANGLKNGNGIYTFANSDIYRGQFRQNMMWGYGIFEFKNGDVYEGNFVNNIRCGKGKYIPRQPNEEGILFFEGEYKNDLKDGPGRVKYQDHEVKGVWKNGLYEFKLPPKLFLE